MTNTSARLEKASTEPGQELIFPEESLFMPESSDDRVGAGPQRPLEIKRDVRVDNQLH